jgi:ADP-heptose:LPS heptosyltransferase
MHGGINNIIEYHGEKIGELKKIINNNNYDLIFDLHKNIRSILSTFLTQPEKVRYKKGTLKKLLIVAFKLNLIDIVIPVYKRYLLPLFEIHFLDSLSFITSELNFNKERIVGEPYILIAPSSKHFTKALPKEKFESIIKEIKSKKIVLIGDDSERDKSTCAYLTATSGNVINYCGKTDYNTLANLIFHSDLVLCNDSGVLHLAEALNKKIIAFFGSTVKEFGFYPQLKSTIVFENNNLKCRPCTHIGKDKCPKKHFKCMNEINVNEIINKINENIS